MIKTLYDNQEIKKNAKKSKIETFATGELKDFVKEYYGNEDDTKELTFTGELDQALQAFYLEKNYGLKSADFSKKIKNGKNSEQFTTIQSFYALLA